jgi:hypothetical protein
MKGRHFGAPPPTSRAPWTAVVLAAGAALLAGGATAVGVVVATQQHAPQPTRAQAGALGPPAPHLVPSAAAPVGRSETPGARVAGSLATAAIDRAALALAERKGLPAGPALARSRPVGLDIPAIGVDAHVGEVGLNANGTIQVPPLFAKPSEAAWYRYSPTPGQPGPSVIVGHVDNIYGPAVFFRIGALVPGDHIGIALADGDVANFMVDGVRTYSKAHFPTAVVYGSTSYPALRLITCGGPFDYSTRQYLDNTVVFASLVTAHASPSAGAGAGAGAGAPGAGAGAARGASAGAG